MKPRHCQSRAPKDVSKEAECSKSSEPSAKASSENILEWEGQQEGDAEPDVVDGHEYAVELLHEDHHVDDAFHLGGWADKNLSTNLYTTRSKKLEHF